MRYINWQFSYLLTYSHSFVACSLQSRIHQWSSSCLLGQTHHWQWNLATVTRHQLPSVHTLPWLHRLRPRRQKFRAVVPVQSSTSWAVAPTTKSLLKLLLSILTWWPRASRRPTVPGHVRFCFINLIYTVISHYFLLTANCSFGALLTGRASDQLLQSRNVFRVGSTPKIWLVEEKWNIAAVSWSDSVSTDVNVGGLKKG